MPAPAALQHEHARKELSYTAALQKASELLEEVKEKLDASNPVVTSLLISALQVNRAAFNGMNTAYGLLSGPGRVDEKKRKAAQATAERAIAAYKYSEALLNTPGMPFNKEQWSKEQTTIGMSKVQDLQEATAKRTKLNASLCDAHDAALPPPPDRETFEKRVEELNTVLKQLSASLEDSMVAGQEAYGQLTGELIDNEATVDDGVCMFHVKQEQDGYGEQGIGEEESEFPLQDASFDHITLPNNSKLLWAESQVESSPLNMRDKEGSRA
ncbi:hypothetical protein CBER1_03097 [Cercospora berteroae]|uniref:Uncharacterized protein n=1 Tax=Cercospora berteroae TaxID=357750 RepID=A0A2S6CK87_9PEZI|nr:hypothetical protein CBER1_03097 [Cercospora berteroae]